MFLEDPVIERDRKRRQTDRARIPGQFQFARRAGQGRRIGSGFAKREFGKIDASKGSAWRKGLRTERAGRSGECDRKARLQQRTAVDRLFLKFFLWILFVSHIRSRVWQNSAVRRATPSRHAPANCTS